MKLTIIPGTTSKIISLFISDSSKTDGSGLASLVFNSAGLICKYKREGQAGWTTITLVTATEGTWISRGFIEDNIALGNYELHLPDAVLVYEDGVTWVRLFLYGATNMAPLPIEIQLDVDTMIVKGLLGVNMVLDDFSYNSKKKATIGNIYIYDTVANANAHVSGGSSGLVAEIDGVAVVDADGNTTKLTRTVA